MSVSIEDYSEKCILLKGETKVFKKHIMDIGGKWNGTLKGWVFPKTKKDIVKELTDKINNGKIEPVIEDSEKFFISKEQYLALVSRVEWLENKLGRQETESKSKKNVSKTTKKQSKKDSESEESETSESEESEPEEKKTSFLKKKNKK
jgi:hypothetical protein